MTEKHQQMMNAEELERRRLRLFAELQEVDGEQRAVVDAQARVDEEALGLEVAARQLAKEEAELQRRKRQIQQQAVSIGDRRTELLDRGRQVALLRTQVEDSMQEIATLQAQRAQAPSPVEVFEPAKAPAAETPQAVQVQTLRSDPAARPEDPANRRTSPRANLVVDVAMQTENNFFMGLTENLSEGGLFIATYDQIPHGTVLDVDVNLPGHATIHAKASVCWIREYNQFTQDMAPGVGVQFLDLAEADSVVIREFIRRRDPILYDLG